MPHRDEKKIFFRNPMANSGVQHFGADFTKWPGAKEYTKYIPDLYILFGVMFLLLYTHIYTIKTHKNRCSSN